MSVVITLIYIIFIFIDVVPIVKRKQWNTFTVYVVIMVSSFILFVLSSTEVLKPNFNTWFMELIDTVFGDPKGNFTYE